MEQVMIRFPVGWDGVKFTQPYDQSLHHIELWYNPNPGFADFIGVSFNWNMPFAELPADAKHSYVDKNFYHKLTLAECKKLRDDLTEVIERMEQSNGGEGH